MSVKMSDIKASKRLVIFNMTKAQFKTYLLNSKAKTNLFDLYFMNKERTISYCLQEYRKQVKQERLIDCTDFKAFDYSRIKTHLRFRINKNNRIIRVNKVEYSRKNLDAFNALTFDAKTKVIYIK